MTDNLDGLTISSIKDKSEAFGVAANRIWKEWWEKKGQTEQDVIDGLRKALEGNPCYDGFAASRNGTYLGSALVIKSDMEERPSYTPWVAAVFVEPEHRGQGVGAALVNYAAQNTLKNGVPHVYLCATKKNSPYYEKLGWEKVEEDVGADGLTIFIKNSSDCQMGE